MENLYIILFGIACLIYIIAIKLPRDIKKVENKVDVLQLHLKEIELKLNQINKKLDN